MKECALMNLNYKNTFLQWELAVAKKIVYEYQQKYGCLKRIDFNDLLQEVISHWYFNKGKFELNRKASKKTFMAKIVKNKLNDILREELADKRKINSQAFSLNQSIGEDENNPDYIDNVTVNNIPTREAISNPFLSILKKIDIDKTLQKLNPKQQIICELIMSKDLNISDLSKCLNTPRSTVYDEIDRIRKIFEKAGLKKYIE